MRNRPALFASLVVASTGVLLLFLASRPEPAIAQDAAGRVSSVTGERRWQLVGMEKGSLVVFDKDSGRVYTLEELPSGSMRQMVWDPVAGTMSRVDKPQPR